MFNYEVENNEYENLEECVNVVYELASKYAVPTSEAKKIELKRKIKHIIAPIIRNRGGIISIIMAFCLSSILNKL